jgi:hypothetical protein
MGQFGDRNAPIQLDTVSLRGKLGMIEIAHTFYKKYGHKEQREEPYLGRPTHKHLYRYHRHLKSGEQA